MSTVIPVTIVDNFFDDPELIRSYALSLEYSPDETLKTPGVKSKQLYYLNPSLFNIVLKKVTSIFYPNIDGVRWEASMCFQLVNKNFMSGWVHKDNGLISGMIYLTPNPDHSGGTTIYKRKYSGASTINFEQKQKTFSLANSNKTITNDLIVDRNNNNEQFRETITIKNEFNRLVAFDACEFHSANTFFGETLEDTRLTLLFFIYRLHSDDVLHYPATRIKFQ